VDKRWSFKSPTPDPILERTISIFKFPVVELVSSTDAHPNGELQAMVGVKDTEELAPLLNANNSHLKSVMDANSVMDGSKMLTIQP